MATRVYKVTSATDTRLVEAMNSSQAIRHAARAQYTATVATQTDLVALVLAGTVVEQAKEASEPLIVNGVADGHFAEAERGKEAPATEEA